MQFPVAAHGSPFDFLFAQENVQRRGDGGGALAKCLRQIVHAHNYVAARVALVDFATVGRNPISDAAQFLLPI